MRTNEILEQVLAPVGLPVKYYEYAGTKDSYIVYNEEYEQPVVLEIISQQYSDVVAGTYICT